MKHLLTGFVATLCLAATSAAGTFAVSSDRVDRLEVHYTGTVEPGDVERWEIITEQAAGRPIILTIDTPGGYAYVGLDLYWALEDYDGLATIAGNTVGAWSAGAVMWLAGDYRHVDAGGVVAFHRAYCQWDPLPFPEIGCDPIPVDILFASLATDAGYDGMAFAFLLIIVQHEMGTDGWVMIDSDSRYWIVDSSSGTKIEFYPKEILP